MLNDELSVRSYEASSIDWKALSTHLRPDPAFNRFLKGRIAFSRSVRYQS